MYIKTDADIYELYFQHAQIEVTGRCNMKCQHCRAWDEPNVHMPIGMVGRILAFAVTNAEDDFRLTISGGEPFLYPNLVDAVRLSKDAGINKMIITTNGSLVTDKKLEQIEKIGVKDLCIQVSIDSVNPQQHNLFRGHENAFEKGIDAIKRISRTGLSASLRSTITPSTLDEVERLVDLARESGAIRISMGSVIPAGRGKINQQLALSSNQKKLLMEKLTACKKQSVGINITTEDPLQYATQDKVWNYGGGDISDEDFFGGCSAAITSFNAESDGTITPCAVLLKPITNVKDKSPKEILSAYTSSPVTRALVARQFKDNCGICDLRRLCGGCRAVAEGVYGDYLASDNTCWYKPKAQFPALNR